MEHEDTRANNYDFLEETKVRHHFADLNIKLLSGRHIQEDEFHLYSLLTDYFEELSAYYENLYHLKLVREIFDNVVYYYLDFYEGSRGALGDISRSKQLTEWQTMVGLMLLDLYYTRYFDDPKEIKWSHVKQEIEAGDRKQSLQTLFFGETRSGFSKNEWLEVEKKWRNTIGSFHELGWVEKLSNQNEELHFTIKPAIHRLASMYSREMEHLDEYITLFKGTQAR
jgi:chromosome condensin MukBEF MukE localization factor